ncbi:MAG: alpha-amylase [Calditrichaeota bacterium]|nr:alpha-amylase [Calditrichota bacterium]
MKLGQRIGTIWVLLAMLFLVLYCEKKHGKGEPLPDYSSYSAPLAPEWARNGVLYEIYIRAFTPEGTFRAAIQRLDALQELGVNILWLMPIYPIGEKGRKGTLGSPYSVKDFRKVNPEFGTEADFRAFVQAAHQRGMKVILDMVPNHGANDNVLMADHPDWFMWDEAGNFTREVADWSDITDFNYDNPDMRRYMQETMQYWIREFDIDGYRCDVAGMVPLDFWEETLPRLREIKPDIYLLAEWEDPKLLIAGFHSDYDWTLYHLLKDVRKQKKRTAEAIQLIYEKDSRYPQNALPMRFLENHDEPRSLEMFGPAAIEAYATFIFTVPGLPLIYAGQEIGETVRPSLFEKFTIRWQEGDTALFRMYQRLIRWRKQYPVLRHGEFIPLGVATFKGSVGAFLRRGDQGLALVATNLWPDFAEKVVVTLPEHLRETLGTQELYRIDQPEERLSLSEMVFDEFPPFTTRVYVGTHP